MAIIEKCRFLLQIVLVFIIMQCTIQKTNVNDETCDFEISFGETGGFSNINPVYKIVNNGDVLKQDNERSDFHILKKLDKQKVDSICLLIKNCDFTELNINKVSNITHFINIKSGKISRTEKWSDESQIPEKLSKLYKYISSVLK